MLPLLTAILITVADQWTKHAVRATFDYGESVPVITGFFSLTYVRNTGAAWGMLGGHTHILTIVSIIMLIAMIVFRRAFLNNTWSHRLALGLMIGGIIGNLLDRIRQNWVTDFLDFYVGGWHWPCFNIADSAICIGVGIYLVTGFLKKEEPAAETSLSSS